MKPTSTVLMLPLALLVFSSALRAELIFDPVPINNILNQVATTDPGVQGISALVSYKGKIAYERYLDGHTNGQVLDLASASKWMSGVTMLTVWDDGLTISTLRYRAMSHPSPPSPPATPNAT